MRRRMEDSMTVSVVVVAVVGDVKASSEMELLLLLQGQTETAAYIYQQPCSERFWGEIRNNSNDNTLQRIHQLKWGMVAQW